jgi:hypothetical protein
MNFAARALAAAAGLLVLSGCAADTTNYPSLARRPIERIEAGQQTSPAPAPIAADPGQGARLAGWIERARIAHGHFSATRERAQRLVTAGSGAPRGSESWALASVALAELESARSEAMIALADLDQLYAATRVEGGDTAAITAARDQVSGWIGDEDQELAALRGRLGD